LIGKVSKFEELRDFLQNGIDRRVFVESIRRAYFPMVFAEEEIQGEDEETASKLSQLLMELWEQFNNEASGKMIKSPERDVLRPVKETQWKTVMIPFSTLVAFRYFAQMGYNVGLKAESSM
jgi:hypothetical protein